MCFRILFLLLVWLVAGCEPVSLQALNNKPSSSSPSVAGSTVPNQPLPSPAQDQNEQPRDRLISRDRSPATAPSVPPLPADLAPILNTPIALPPRSITAESGYVRVVMTDAPGDFSKIFFDVSEMMLIAEQPEPLFVARDKLPLELLRLRLNPVVLAEKALPPGQWKSLSFVLSNIRAFDRNGNPRNLTLVTEDREDPQAEVIIEQRDQRQFSAVSGSATIVLTARGIAVKPATMTLLILDFDVKKSVISRDGKDILKPVISLSVSEIAIAPPPPGSSDSPSNPSGTVSPSPEPYRSPLLPSPDPSRTPFSNLPEPSLLSTPTPTPRFDRLRG